MKYLNEDFSWSDEAVKKFGIPNEMPTICRLSELIGKGHFLVRRPVFSAFSNQKIKFIALPKELYDYYIGQLFDRKYSAISIEKTGYIFFDGYPIIYA